MPFPQARVPAAALSVVIGVKAIDNDGNESLVAAYLEPVRQSLTAPPAEVPDSNDNGAAQ